MCLDMPRKPQRCGAACERCVVYALRRGCSCSGGQCCSPGWRRDRTDKEESTCTHNTKHKTRHPSRSNILHVHRLPVPPVHDPGTIFKRSKPSDFAEMYVPSKATLPHALPLKRLCPFPKHARRSALVHARKCTIDKGLSK